MRSDFAHIERVREGIYKVRFDLGRDPMTGRRRRMSKTITAKNGREARMRAHVLAARAGRPLGGESLTYLAYSELWLEDADVRARTREDYDATLRSHILPYFGGMMVASITPLAVKQWLRSLDRAGRSAHVVAKAFRVFRASVNDAVKPYGILERSPTEPVEPPKVPRRELEVLTPEEAQAYLALFAGHRYEIAVMLALTCGMRRSEIAALDRQSLRGGVISILRGLHASKGGGTHFEPPKSKRSRRDVRPPDFVVERWPKGFGPLFPTASGGYTSPRAIQQSYERHIRPVVNGQKTERVRYVTLRDLRHSSATLLLSMGLSMEEVRDILGHEDIRTTQTFYDRSKRSDNPKAAAKMQELFGGQKWPSCEDSAGTAGDA